MEKIPEWKKFRNLRLIFRKNHGNFYALHHAISRTIPRTTMPLTFIGCRRCLQLQHNNRSIDSG